MLAFHTLSAQEPALRFGIFAVVFAALAIWEMLAPQQRPAPGSALRSFGNYAVFVLDIALVRLVFPFAAVAMAGLAQQAGWGLFNQFSAPLWVSLPACLLALDLAIYGQHRLFHAVPLLWRAHRMHHSDTGFDVSTGLRFHPLEIGVSLAFKFAVVAALGAPPLAVLLFEAILNAASLFSHANIGLPVWCLRFLPWLLVTPPMHRLHHSVDPVQASTNFGFCLPWWDWLFGTFLNPASVAAPVIGLQEFRGDGEHRLDRMLMQPFAGAITTKPGKSP